MGKLQKGYTLIEFLIILSIALILLIICLPPFTKQNDQQYSLTCDGVTIDHSIFISRQYNYENFTIFKLNDDSEYKCYKYSLERVK